MPSNETPHPKFGRIPTTELICVNNKSAITTRKFFPNLEAPIGPPIGHVSYAKVKTLMSLSNGDDSRQSRLKIGGNYVYRQTVSSKAHPIFLSKATSQRPARISWMITVIEDLSNPCQKQLDYPLVHLKCKCAGSVLDQLCVSCAQEWSFESTDKTIPNHLLIVLELAAWFIYFA